MKSRVEWSGGERRARRGEEWSEEQSGEKSGEERRARGARGGEE